jgi:hypothetical protein
MESAMTKPYYVDLIPEIIASITEPGVTFDPGTDKILGMQLLIGCEQVLALRRIAEAVESIAESMPERSGS